MRLADSVVMRLRHLAEDFGPPPATDLALQSAELDERLAEPAAPVQADASPDLAQAVVEKGLRLPPQS